MIAEIIDIDFFFFFIFLIRFVPKLHFDCGNRLSFFLSDGNFITIELVNFCYYILLFKKKTFGGIRLCKLTLLVHLPAHTHWNFFYRRKEKKTIENLPKIFSLVLLVIYLIGLS